MKSTRYAHYNINYHFVWTPKYREPILKGKVFEHLKKILKNIARKKDGVEIKSIEIQPDLIHLFVSAKPKYSPSKLINIFKGASSRKLRNQHPKLKQKDKLWTRTYYVETGKLNEKTIKRFIEECP